jgi:predicted RNA-binding Zn-ribbon protein involved in translation (DUF1610 family)
MSKQRPTNLFSDGAATAHTLEQFQLRFPYDYACTASMAKKRWPGGFVCPHCGSTKGWKQRSSPLALQVVLDLTWGRLSNIDHRLALGTVAGRRLLLVIARLLRRHAARSHQKVCQSGDNSAPFRTAQALHLRCIEWYAQLPDRHW